jgi:hypothetical protein
MYTEREASGSCQQKTCQRLAPTVVNRLWIRNGFNADSDPDQDPAF